jgi:ribonuclease P protein component
MLPRSNRIPKKLFPGTSSGKVFSNNAFTLKFLAKNGSNEEFRAGVVVSKKVAKTAVKRNLLRRRVYAVIRGEKAKIPKGARIIIYAKSGATDLSFAELKHGITELFKSALV